MVKISRPTPKDAYLRQRLFKQLDRMRSFAVTWVSAPAGSGKTTLVSSYIEHRKIPCLWYQLDQGDGDLATFFYYLGQAAKKAAPRKRKPLPMLTPEYLQGLHIFALRYFEELCARVKPPFLFVFDNYQEVPAPSALHEVMAHALSHIPEGLNVLVLSRTDPPAPLVRLKANGLLDRLSWQEMRFTAEEARAIVRRRTGSRCSEKMLQPFYDLADGWAAGLVLISEALKKEKTAIPFQEKLSFAEIFAYFSHEIFERLDRATQDFFLTTAFLPKMTVRTAQELTANPAAGNTLQTLNGNNYFITRQFTTEAVYEYHPLFRDFLLERAGKTYAPEVIAAIRRRAAALLIETQQPEAAAELLIQADDWPTFIPLVLNNAAAMLAQGRGKTLQAWLAHIPGALAEKTPWLIYWTGACELSVHPGESRRMFARAFELFNDQGDETGALLSWSGAVLTFSIELHDFKELDQWIHWLDERNARGLSFSSHRIEASIATGMAAALTWRMPFHPDINKWVQRSLSLVHESLSPEENLRIYTNSVMYHFWMGDFEPCALSVNEIKKMVRAGSTSPLRRIILKNMEAMFYNMSAAYNEQAAATVLEGLKIAEETGVHVFSPLLLVQGACAALSDGDVQRCEEFLARLEKTITGIHRMNAGTYFCLSAWCDLAKGNVSEAVVSAVKSLQLIEEAGTPAIEIAVRPVVIHALHQAGNDREARRHLAVMDEKSSQIKSHYYRYMYCLTEAYFAFTGDQQIRALEALRQALTLGRRQRFTTLLYFWCPDVLSLLCVKALENGIETDYVRDLIRILHLTPDPPPITIEHWPWPIKIYTLGKFALLRNDLPLQFAYKVQQKPLALLKALIALGGRDVHEDRLTDLLWPEADGDLAHQSFRTTLHRLRKLLVHPEALLFQEGHLSLNERVCWVDARAFERLPIETDARHPIQAEPLQQARGLYHGPFLSGEREEPWMVSLREKLRGKYLRAVHKLAAVFENGQDWEQAAKCYEDCLKVDDCVEEIYLGLMRCYQNLGRNRDVRAVYDRCRKTFADMFGAKPSPVLETLYASLNRPAE